MKPILFFAFLLLHTSLYCQLTFEEVAPFDDFCIGLIRKSPIGEYFIQTTNDPESIYTSMNGKNWTKSAIPFSTNNEIRFFSDGTPVLQSVEAEHLIRRNGTWYTLDPGAGWDNVYASCIKDDTLFIFQGNRFAYSVDKGQTYTILFTNAWDIKDQYAHIWTFKNYLVLHHYKSYRDSLSVFTRQGKRIAAYELDLQESPRIIYNSCGELLFIDNDHYYRLREQGLVFTTGRDTEIIPYNYSYFDLRSQDGNYYVRHNDTLYISHGCTYDWQPLLVHHLIDDLDFFLVNPGEDLLLYNNHGNFFFEQSGGTNVWEEFLPLINYAMVLKVDESAKDRQVSYSYHSIFTKLVDETGWTLLDTNTVGGYDVQYAPNGTLYIAMINEILYSVDNGHHFSIISIPMSPFPNGILNYSLEVLGNGILLLYRYKQESFYTVNNGHDWFPFTLSGGSETPIISLVDNYIQFSYLKKDYFVERVHLGTGEVTPHEIGSFTKLSFGGSAVLDNGTMFFQARNNMTPTQQGLFRYRFGESPELIGQLPGSVNLWLFGSGPNLYAINTHQYSVVKGNEITTYPITGMNTDGSPWITMAENDHVYIIWDNHRIFRSTTALSYPRLISGTIYHNQDENCMSDTLDPKLAFWQVQVEKNNFLRVTNTDSAGNFEVEVPIGEFTLSTKPPSYNWDVCDNDFHVTVDSTDSRVIHDFLALGVNDCAELSMDFSTPLLRRCFENVYYVRVRNTGPESSDGTTVRLILDPYFEFISSTVPYTKVEDLIYDFDLGVLELNEEIQFQVRFNISCDAALGIEHCLKGILMDDALCADERSSYVECQNNRGSIDPNDKRIFNEAGKETEQIDKGEYIYYNIRFQNTGTDTAFNVRIVDPLSPMLDYSTLEMLSASHPYNYFLTDGPALNILFQNILLPDSVINEPASHGFVKFRIKPLQEFDYGTSIPNTAGIIFDFNDPVLTNEASLFILPPVKTTEPDELVDFQVFPNPANDVLVLKISPRDLNRVDAVEIIDQLGRVLKSFDQLIGNTIDVSDLANGMYTLVLKEKEVMIGEVKFVRSE